MYNSSVVSSFTPSTLGVAEGEAKIKMDAMIKLGAKECKHSNVVIVSMLRDTADKISEIIKKTEGVGNLFRDYRILIVENDSSDGTREALLEWSKRNPRVTILGCGVNVEKCHIAGSPKTEGHSVDRARIEKMTKLRNIYMDHLKSAEFRREFLPNYVIAWDLDATASVYHDGIQNSIGHMVSDPELSTVCAYGIYRWGVLTLFYDTYALLHKDEEFHIDYKAVHDLRKGMWEAKSSLGDDPVEVDSCFSGFTIYRFEALESEDVYYDMSPPDNIECEHVRLHRRMSGKKVYNPSMINFLLENR